MRVNNRGDITHCESKQACSVSVNLPQGVMLEMVSIPGGTFRMGSFTGEGCDEEKPQHQVTIPPFFIGKYPITQAQWRVVIALPQEERKLLYPSCFKGDHHPVENVSWYDAVEFCARLSKFSAQQYRLPSEAEWEYACRAGTTTSFYFGETITPKLANTYGNYTYGDAPKGECRGKTTDVGTFPPNDFGLYDMHGNIWEWCADNWHNNYLGAPIDGSIWTNGNERLSVVRGGSYCNKPNEARCAFRTATYSCNDWDEGVGFRVVRQ